MPDCGPSSNANAIVQHGSACSFSPCWLGSSLADADLRSPPLLSSDVIVQRLMAANAQRSQALRGYHGMRTYHLDYHGLFGSHDAGMQVEAILHRTEPQGFQSCFPERFKAAGQPRAAEAAQQRTGCTKRAEPDRVGNQPKELRFRAGRDRAHDQVETSMFWR